MNQEVLVSISGLQFEVDPDKPIELISPGQYLYKNEKHYIMYEEISEEGGSSDGISKNLLKIGKNKIELTKKGCSNATMVFEKDRKALTCYSTPYGELIIGIQTTDLEIKESPDSLTADIQYSLDINYSHVADCHIHIHIQNRRALS